MTLRKLCNHPILAFRQGKVVWAEDSELPEGDATGIPEELSSESLQWEDSGKLLVLSKVCSPSLMFSIGAAFAFMA